MEAGTMQRFIDSVGPAFAAGDPAVAGKAAEAKGVAAVEAGYRALARGDFPAFLATLDEDIELQILGPAAVPLVGHWRGKSVVAAAVRDNFGGLEDQRPELLSVVAQGDTVVVFAREQGRVKATGREYEMHWVQVFTCRDGRVTRVRQVFDSAPMLAALSRDGAKP